MVILKSAHKILAKATKKTIKTFFCIKNKRIVDFSYRGPQRPR